MKTLKNMAVATQSVLTEDLTITGTLRIKPGASLDLNGHRLWAVKISGVIISEDGNLKIVHPLWAETGSRVVLIGEKEEMPATEKPATEKPATEKPVTQDVICQKWEESERGWGTRPDGYSLHLTEQDRKNFIDRYNRWGHQGQSNDDTDGWEVPDTYSRPCGTPYSCAVAVETIKELSEAKAKGVSGVRYFRNDYPGGGTDGWRHVK